MTAVYAGGPLYTGGSPVIKDLKASGFTTVVAWAMHVQGNGDFVFNDPTNLLISQGRYVGHPGWPTQMNSLKQGVTSVNRILFSIGGWGVSDFPNIKSLIFAKPGSYPNKPDIGPSSILYQNFRALKMAIPSIDGIDFDDETLYDEPTTVALSQLLHSLGYQVTFCPYTQANFWINCLYALNSQTPNLVTGFNLQCYAGGSGNDPANWITAIQNKMGTGFDAKGFVFPGLWCKNGSGCQSGQCPTGTNSISAQFNQWQHMGIQGGFIWLYDDILHCEHSGVCSGPMTTAAYARAIGQGLTTSVKTKEFSRK